MPACLRAAAYSAALLLSSERAMAHEPARPAAAARPAPDDVSRLVDGRILERGAYVRAVLKANPSIEAARQGWRAARARVREAGAFEDPMLDVGIAPLSIASSNAPFGYQVGVSQRLPWFGTRALERTVMTAEAAAAASDVEATRREIAMTALVLYDQYYVAMRSLEVNTQHVELVSSLQAAATAQFEAGRGLAADSLQAEAELTRLEYAALVLEADRDVIVAQMNELLHRDPGAALPPPVAELEAPAAAHVDDVKHLEQEAVAKRAEISAARQRARAESSRADAANREYYPTFTLSTSYSSMWSMPEHRWMVGVGVNVPWPNDRRAGAIDRARAMRAQYQSEVERLSDTARAEVYVALRKLDESERVLQHFRQRLLPVARDQVDAVRAAFIASRVQFAPLIEAEKNLRSVELDYRMAQAESDRRHGELDRALGRIPGLDNQESKR
jgi:cobalt-zinc-cadmium efflux system outer membrane protein